MEFIARHGLVASAMQSHRVYQLGTHKERHFVPVLFLPSFSRAISPGWPRAWWPQERCRNSLRDRSLSCVSRHNAPTVSLLHPSHPCRASFARDKTAIEINTVGENRASSASREDWRWEDFTVVRSYAHVFLPVNLHRTVIPISRLWFGSWNFIERDTGNFSSIS